MPSVKHDVSFGFDQRKCSRTVLLTPYEGVCEAGEEGKVGEESKGKQT